MSNLVAVVAGATRGAGRGIARGLGEVGATVYCTGRSVRGKRSDYNRSETIEETADLVAEVGGVGIPVQVDHSIEAEVSTLFDRVIREHGHVDLLVNTIGGESPTLGGGSDTFWTLNLDDALKALEQTILTHVITAKHAAARMVPRKRGLILEITEGDIPGMASGNILSDLQKSCHKSLAWRMANELRDFNVAALAVTPGFLRSEVVLDHFQVTEEDWKDAGKQDEHFLASESPLFAGRVVARLTADPDIMSRSGDLTSTWELARLYDITDVDGTRPDWGQHMTETVLPELDWYRQSMLRQVEWLERMAARGRRYLS